MAQQRFSILDLAPPWLNDETSRKYLTIFGNAQDMLLEKSDAASRCAIPGYGDPSVLPYQAADRMLVQGPAESNAAFIVRLSEAFDAWGRAGSRPAVLEQVQAYLTNLQPGVDVKTPALTIVSGNSSLSQWDTIYGYMAQGAAPAKRVVSPANWNWDGTFTPTQAWLILYMHLVATGQSGAAAKVASTGGSGVTGVTSGFATITGLSGITLANVQQYLTCSGGASSANRGTFQIVAVLSSTSVIIANTAAVVDASGTITWSIGAYPFIGPAPVWGSPSFVWGQGTWGVNCSSQVIDSIRAIVKQWKSAQTYYPRIIVSFGGADGTAGSEFSPLSSQGAGNPDGTWGGIGKKVNGAWVAAPAPTNPFTAICDGTGLAIQCYEKNVS